MVSMAALKHSAALASGVPGLQAVAERTYLVDGGRVSLLEGGVPEYVEQLGAGKRNKLAAAAGRAGGGEAYGKAITATRAAAAADERVSRQARALANAAKRAAER